MRYKKIFHSFAILGRTKNLANNYSENDRLVMKKTDWNVTFTPIYRPSGKTRILIGRCKRCDTAIGDFPGAG